MSLKIKLCSGGKAVKKFQRAGWTPVRHCGSHVMLTKPAGRIPPQIENVGFKVYKYVDYKKLEVRIIEAVRIAEAI